MKKFSLLSLAAIAALASDPVAIQKITVEASAPIADIKSVEADEMVKFSRQSDLGEILSQTLPEITHVRNSAIGNDIILRGFRKDNLNITIDDAKVHGACPNRMDPPSMHISSSQIKSVEVQEGPFDVTQFGSLGGKINVVTKDPSKGLGGEVSATLGSYDYRKLSTTVEGGDNNVQALVGFSRETSGQYKDGNGKTLTEQTDTLASSAAQKYAPSYKNMNAYERNTYWGKIVGNITNNQKITLNYFGDRVDNVLYPRYPMDALKDDTDMLKVTYQIFNLAEYSKELKMEGYHSKVTHLMGTNFRVGSGTTMVAPAVATTQGARIENKLTFSGLTLTTGLDANQRNWNATKGAQTTPSGNIMLPDVNTDNLALYAKASKTISHYDLTGGIRFDETTIKPTTSLQDGASNSYLSTRQNKNFHDVSAHFMSKYNYTPMTNVFIGIGQSVRVPDAKELYLVSTNTMGTVNTNTTSNGGNNNLSETKNREIDLGAEHTVGKAHIKGTMFYSDLKDYIYAYATTGTTSTWANIDARIVGLDLKADLALNNDWMIQSGMAYQKGTKKDPSKLGQTNKNLAEIPPLKGRIALVFDNTFHYAMAEWIAAKNQTIDSDNGEKDLSGYAILNLKYGTKLGHGFSVSTGINNFFDRTYAVNNGYIGNQLLTATGTNPLVLNEPGRNIYATLSYKF